MGYWHWPPLPPTPTRGERIVYRFERFADTTRKQGRRARNFVRRNATCVLTYADYLLLAVKWQLFGYAGTGPPRNTSFVRNPICVFSFLERHDLESCQMVCKQWQRTIEENYKQLALRVVDYFWLDKVEYVRHKVGCGRWLLSQRFV